MVVDGSGTVVGRSMVGGAVSLTSSSASAPAHAANSTPASAMMTRGFFIVLHAVFADVTHFDAI